MSNTKFDVDKIAMISIKTIAGNIAVPPDFTGSPGIYKFDFGASTNIEEHEKLIRFVLNVTISNVDEHEVPTGIKAGFTNEFIYQVGNLEEQMNVVEETKTPQLNLDLWIAVANMAYGTMRGIIHMRTQGTILNGIIIPIIKPAILISPKKTEPQQPVN